MTGQMSCCLARSWLGIIIVALTLVCPCHFAHAASSRPESVNTIRDLLARLQSCWRSPPRANPIDVTVVISFKRSGEILGRPRVTFESPEATENDRLQYRVAVMEALERCAPIPFSVSMGAAVVGRPFAVTFGRKKNSSPKELGA